MTRDLTIRKTLISAVLLPAVTMLALVSVLVWQVTSLMAVTSWVEHTDSVITHASSTHRRYLDAVVEFRGYLLTGEKPFLDRFEAHTRGLTTEIEDLCSLCRDNPRQALACSNIRYLVSRWTHLGHEVFLSPIKGEGPRQVLKRLSPVVDTVRASYAEFIGNEARLRAGRVQDVKESVRWFWRVTFSALVLVALLIGVNSWGQIAGVARHYERLKNNELAFVAELKQTVARLSQEIEERGLVESRLRLEAEERQKAEEAANRNGRQLRMLASIVENSTDFVAAATPDHKVIFLNPAGRKLMGLESQEVDGTSISDYFSEEWRLRVRNEILPLVEKNGLWQGETLFRNFKTGQSIPVIYSKFAVRDPGGKTLFYATVTRDITGLKRSEKKLREYAARLAESNAELARFAFVASHDLKEPLRVVSSYSQLLGRQYRGRLDAKADVYIDYVVKGVERMYGLIQDLLNYSHVGAVHGAPARVKTRAVFESALANLETALQESGARVICGDLPEVTGNSTQLQQLFQNLIGNAIKYRSGARPAEVRIAAKPEHGYWIFSVADNGIGIDPAYHDKVFVLFHRLHTKDEYAGTGIGLAVCKKIVERHGGRLWVESKVDAGSTFFFTLPAEKQDRTRAG